MLLCEVSPTPDTSPVESLAVASALAREILSGLRHTLAPYDRTVPPLPRYACISCKGEWSVVELKVNFYGVELRCWSLEEELGDDKLPEAPIAPCGMCMTLRRATVGDI